MTNEIEKARREMETEYVQFRDKGLGRIHEVYQRLESLKAEDDLYGILLALEDAVKAARTGGVFGEGAGGHRRARDAWMELTNPKKK